MRATTASMYYSDEDLLPYHHAVGARESTAKNIYSRPEKIIFNSAMIICLLNKPQLTGLIAFKAFYYGCITTAPAPSGKMHCDTHTPHNIFQSLIHIHEVHSHSRNAIEVS